MTLSRREFVQLAAAMGASLAWGGSARASTTDWHERRDLYPEGVASGDPDPSSVILWTRRPFESGGRRVLTVEVAEDEAFRRVVAKASAPVSAESDWTTRVLVGHLEPARVYWYRFTDADGNGSRVGRTITAPPANDPRPVNFAFVSCQNVNEGKLNAYRRMIFEDERAAPADQLGFVLHLGDFIYEVVEYPDEVKTRYDRTIYEVCRIPDGGKTGNFHFPLTVDGYRAIYKGYLADPDLQDARARWPFVAIWDNHEFSWQGRQSIVQAGGPPQPGQTVKVAANQAWFEYLPARVKAPSGSLDTFGTLAVKNVPIENWDANGLGIEPNNLKAINSLIAYRSLRYGRHLDLILTDQHSFRGDDPTDAEGVGKIDDPAFNGMFSEPAMIALDAGRTFNGGNPPAELRFGDVSIPNPRKDSPPRTILGAAQKQWFMDQLRRSAATWKIWGNSLGALDLRADPAEPPRRTDQADVAGRHLRADRQRRLRQRLRRARRDLRPRARCEDHRIRDRVGRPSQLLGRLCRRAIATRQVRAGRDQLRRRLAGQPWRDGGVRAQASQGSSAACAVPRRSAGGPARVDVQHAPEARRPLVPRIRQEFRPEARARRLQSVALPAPGIRRHGRSRLCDGAAHRR